MKYLLQIYQGSSREEFERLPADEQQAIVEEYLAIRRSPGVIGGDQLQPVETATTVRVENGQLIITRPSDSGKPARVERRSLKELLAFEMPPPKSPAEALASFRMRPGFRIELVAAEPMVIDPISFDWGADGRLW